VNHFVGGFAVAFAGAIVVVFAGGVVVVFGGVFGGVVLAAVAVGRD
jgi:hypothetical protein